MKRVAISTLGCKTNQFESAAMIEQLKAAGYLIVPFNEESDIYIINSCSVTARTDTETRRLIRRARRLNPNARIVATGCYAQIAPDDLRKMPELDSVLGNHEKQRISTFIESTEHSVSNIATISQAEPLKLTSFAEHTRAFLQIQNGCNSFCTYCIVPYARGRSRSVKPEDVLQGVRDLAANGFKEVVLTGIHLGGYGADLIDQIYRIAPKNQINLTNLIKEIDAAGIVQRLRIGSIEPNEVSDDLLSLMTHSKSICPHMHLPLQSGSDSVLERMGRPYRAILFRNLIGKIVETMPYAFIGADVIAGFPGETDAEFYETVQLIDELPLSNLHVFPYSSRPGTKAAGMKGQLSAKTVTERAAHLRGIAKLKKMNFLEKFIGRRLKVLVQNYNDESGLNKGLTTNYISVSFSGKKSLVNEEVLIFITGSNGESLSGEFS